MERLPFLLPTLPYLISILASNPQLGPTDTSTSLVIDSITRLTQNLGTSQYGIQVHGSSIDYS